MTAKRCHDRTVYTRSGFNDRTHPLRRNAGIITTRNACLGAWYPPVFETNYPTTLYVFATTLSGYIYIYIVPVESSCRAKRVEIDTVSLDRKPDMITLAKLHVLGSYPRPDDKQRGNHGFVSAKMVMECVLVMILCIGVCALFSICLIYIFNTCCPIIVLAAFGVWMWCPVVRTLVCGGQPFL